jgi:hypothetical protein
MQTTSAVVLVIDRLGAGWLGPYGNTWLDTPNFNRLAARSVLCETPIADSADLAASCRGLWTGRHRMEPAAQDSRHVAQFASAAGARTSVVTDEVKVAEHPLARDFGDRQLLPPAAAAKSASSIESTGLFAFFDAARASLAQQKSPFMLWLHAQGLSAPWDAPLELRYQFADEDDPDPPDFVQPPNLLLPDKSDPDELLGYVQAYAGQVTLADMCLGLLLDALEEHPLAQQTLLVVTSPRGYPLGEHRRVGSCDDALYSELLHIPALIQFPAHEHALLRYEAIMQPAELCSIIAETCGWQVSDSEVTSALSRELRGMPMEARNVACAVDDNQRAIRTPAWFLRESATSDGPRYELFAKPDDRWEANEVSSRCGDAVELLAAELDRFQTGPSPGRLSESPPLAELLTRTWR